MSITQRLTVAGLLAVLWLIVLASAPGTSTARAQGDAREAAVAAPTSPDAAGAPAADESFLRWLIRASGPIGLVILGMSFYLGALVVWMFFEYRKSVALPEGLMRDVTILLGEKRYPEAYERVIADGSFLGRTLAAGVRKLPSGLANAQRAMEMVNDDVAMEMEHRTTYLSTVGTLGPMIGLVGTVYGMMISFRVMAVVSGTTQTSQLAGGISTALCATLEGIAISIPAISFYAFFRNRIARLSLEVAMAAESMLEQFAPGARPVHPLASAAAASHQRNALGAPPVKAEG